MSNNIKLPNNAYRKLKKGENYTPVVSSNDNYKEISKYSLLWGIFFSIVFSSSAAFLGLKIGQVFEAAIPISILAVGFSSMLKKKNSLLENVIVQSIGSSSGVIVAGAIFTIPGLYILGIETSFTQIFLASLLGGFLGILFLVPFRKYFVKDMHGEYPFPEATATTEVLVAGETGGNQAKILLTSLLVGGVYDFLLNGFNLWKEVVSTRIFGWGKFLSDKFKLEFNMNVGAAVLGLGYIIGLKYALIIACGSFLAWWVFVPVVYYIGQHLDKVVLPANELISNMAPMEIFNNYIRHIGIGAIAAAGIIGIIKSRKIVMSAFKLAKNEIFSKSHKNEKNDRLQKDISMKSNMILLLATLMGVFAFFILMVVKGSFFYSIVGLLIVFIISFLFTTVAANATAIVGTNPVSGMTLMTLIISSIILVSIGVNGNDGILAALLIGGVVCTALSMAGGFITDLKIGYWLGTTPRTQEKYKFLGTLLSAASVGFVILMLNKTYGFGTEPGQLEAPQASAMAAVIKPLMTGQSAPWLLYIAGAFLAFILEWIGVSPLAFALGMYLPLHLNTPILLGGLISYFVTKSSKDEDIVNKRKQKGNLISSGFIAGGAIMGVVSAAIAYLGQEVFHLAGVGNKWNLSIAVGTDNWVKSGSAEILGFIMIALLSVYLYLNAKKTDDL